MQVLNKPKVEVRPEWTANVNCTGCGAYLCINETDLYAVRRNPQYSLWYEYQDLARFDCPLCGEATIYPDYPNPRILPEKHIPAVIEAETTLVSTDGTKTITITDSGANLNGRFYPHPSQEFFDFLEETLQDSFFGSRNQEKVFNDPQYPTCGFRVLFDDYERWLEVRMNRRFSNKAIGQTESLQDSL
jgi:hypothetical protein